MSHRQDRSGNSGGDDSEGRTHQVPPGRGRGEGPRDRAALEADDPLLPAADWIIRHAVDPAEGLILNPDPALHFVFLARDDTRFVVDSNTPRLAARGAVPEEQVRTILTEAYASFVERLLPELGRGLGSHPEGGMNGSPDADRRVEIHVFEAEPLAEGVKLRADGHEVVSLDPLVSDGVHELAVSRLFYVGGLRSTGLTNRPGSLPLPEQCRRLREALGDREFVVTDDDIYTGGTMRQVMAMLARSPLKAVPQIQTGRPEVVGVPLEPVVTCIPPARERMDIGDARDFLLGGGGLVIKLPSGAEGRLPYLLPFVSPAARASIAPEVESDFSRRILELNRAFFVELESNLGRDVRVADLDPALGASLGELYRIPPETLVREVLDWAARDMSKLWAETRFCGVVQERLGYLKLPQQIVLLDVNGTLIPEEQRSPAAFSAEDLAALGADIARLRREGVAVGLCSDSPLQPLQELGALIGITGPVLAENGNVIHHEGWTVQVRDLPGREHLIELIRCCAAGFTEVQPVTAPEFGGQLPRFEAGEWGWGKGRETSLSLFGPPELIRKVGDRLGGIEGISVDCAPEHNFLCVHPGADYRRNKGEVLRTLGRFNISTIMVGNSLSDWVEPDSGVVCAFVGDARIPESVREQAAFIAAGHCLTGVQEILARIYSHGSAATDH